MSNVIKILLSNSVYNKKAILAANYALSGLCAGHIQLETDGTYCVTLEPLANDNELNPKEFEQLFLNELTDQQLRLNLEEKCGPLRELIVRHAFSPLENLEKEVEKLVGRA